MPKILLIDDDAQLGPPLAVYFRRFELDLQLAGRPSEGLAMLRSENFDGAILDVMLPEMDGFALCRLIRKSSDIPIIMLTARGEVTDPAADGVAAQACRRYTAAAAVRRLVTRSRYPYRGAPG